MRHGIARLGISLVATTALAACGASATRSPATPSVSAAPSISSTPSTPSKLPVGAATKPTPHYELEPLRIRVVGTDDKGQPKLVSYDARSLLDKGNQALFADKPEEALRYFRQLASDFPSSRFVGPALYNSGLAYEAKGEFDAAVARYRAVVKHRSTGKDAIDAHMRIGAVLAELRRWSQARASLETLLGRTDLALSPSDRVEAMARLGFVLVEAKAYPRAEKVLSEAVTYYKGLEGVSPLESDYFVAMAMYYRANIPHRQSQAIALRLPDAQLKKDLDRRRSLMFLAYDRYLAAVKIKNAYWATAAGYQMSEMYQELWAAMVRAPIPADLGGAKARIYVEEVHKQGRRLLKAALDGHVANVDLAAAFRTQTSWSKGSRQRSKEIAIILARETAGQLVTPKAPTGVAGAGQGEPTEGTEYVPGRANL